MYILGVRERCGRGVGWVRLSLPASLFSPLPLFLLLWPLLTPCVFPLHSLSVYLNPQVYEALLQSALKEPLNVQDPVQGYHDIMRPLRPHARL